ncbi:hypothetical protein GCM10028793_11400 [Nocardiopsis oceani]
MPSPAAATDHRRERMCIPPRAADRSECDAPRPVFQITKTDIAILCNTDQEVKGSADHESETRGPRSDRAGTRRSDTGRRFSEGPI